MAFSSCFRVENVLPRAISQFKHSNVNGNGSIFSPPISSLALLSSSPLVSPKFHLVKTSASHSLSVKASSSSSSTAIAEPEGIKVFLPVSHSLSLSLACSLSNSSEFDYNVLQINTVPTKPIEGQKTGTSGLRKKVPVTLYCFFGILVFHVVRLWIICLFVALKVKKNQLGLCHLSFSLIWFQVW